MDAARWERLQALFHATTALPEPDRNAFLRDACGGDQDLLDGVLALLAEDARGDSPVDRDVGELAWHVLSAPGADFLPIPRIGRYRVRRHLGEGGMGVVYLAEREDLASLVAIKVLRDAWVSPARLERFAAEQRTLARLTHPSIARIYDADTLPDGTPWFAMEYVEGVPITQYCEERGLPVAERLRLFRDVCEAVQYAHQHLVVHRDLKPSNVLVSSEHGVKLLDFGIARQLDRDAGLAEFTQSHTPLMTPAYAAPEQLRGAPTGIHTDVYALGVMLYQLLTGRRPFDLARYTPGEAETIVAEREPARPSAVNREVGRPLTASRAAWAELDVVCLTAMHKDPARRYPTVDALIRDLDHFVRREPLEARPDTIGYRSRKFVRRHWRPLSAAAMVTALVSGLLTYHTVRLEEARNAALAEVARTQRIQRFMLGLFTAGERHDAPAADLRVLTLLERGTRDARQLDREPAIQAELYQTLGTIHTQLGNYDDAESLLDAALELRRRLHGDGHADVVESLVSLGLVRVDQARLEEAERQLRDAHQLSRVLPAEHPVRAGAAAALGRALRERGAYDAAIALFEEAAALYAAAEVQSDDLTAVRTAMANTHFYAGRIDVAERLYHDILSASRTRHGSRHPSVAHDLLNLAATSSVRGDQGQAERHARNALAILESWYGRDHPETASAMIILGQALRFQERFDEAAALLREALLTQERVYGASHPRVAFALNELGGVTQRQGELDEAEGLYRRALDIYTAVYDGKHARVGVAMANLAGVYVAAGEHARGVRLLRSAIALYEEVLPEGHINTGIAEIRLGLALIRQRRHVEAERALLSGYTTIKAQASSPEAWLHRAQEALVQVYDALEQPDKAAAFRAERDEAPTAAEAPDAGGVR